MKIISFIDAEVEPRHGRVLDIGCFRSDGREYHGRSIQNFANFLNGTDYLCGHNIIKHDLKYLESIFPAISMMKDRTIDTLYWSPLLFPRRPYHALLKDDKLQTDELNNPLNDAKKACDLFNDEVTAFLKLDESLKEIYFNLLGPIPEFKAFFKIMDYSGVRKLNGNFISRLFQPSKPVKEIERQIKEYLDGRICANVNLEKYILPEPVALSYAISIIDTMAADNTERSLTPSWVLRNFPMVEQIVFKLRSSPCLQGCPYCNSASDIHSGLKKWFGFSSFRTYGGDPLQEKAVKAAIENKSLLAVFPTGGGKSLTFQLPALMAGENASSLTVVISPLQSLMKDQVDNLENKGIIEAVTVNGLLDPIERAKAFERIENGSASILYVSPEALRSVSIERILLKRSIARFVIDEAHCFSSWGQDFRVDYLYIADFIKSIQEKKNLHECIPVSCFTATAKPQVIEDIKLYFKSHLYVDLELFTTVVSRPNLHYTVLPEANDKEKYHALRRLLEESDCPAIVYVIRTKKAEEIAEHLRQDGFLACAYHGKMSTDTKIANQNSFMNGDVRIMVATSAFGMGVDKSDVGLVIHFEISDSLENYVQEAGRAGRDQNIEADCYVLFNEEDLSKHFLLLNQTKMTIKEIRQVWKAIKNLTRFRSRISNSALEIARQAGWDDGVSDIETRVRTALASLEQAGYLKRGQNVPRIFATGILARTAQEAIDKIENSSRFDEGQARVHAIRIIKMLVASRSRKGSSLDEAESRVDYISDLLGIPKKETVHVINLLREEKVLADSKDITAYFPKGENIKKPIAAVNSFAAIENFLTSQMDDCNIIRWDYKRLNEAAMSAGVKGVEERNVKTILNIWAVNGWIKKKPNYGFRNQVEVRNILELTAIKAKIQERQKLALFIVEYIYGLASEISVSADTDYVQFSIMELKDAYVNSILDSYRDISAEDVEDALFYLSRIGAVKIEGGFMVIYNTMTIERLEMDNKRQYKIADYERLGKFYENKIQQIHIVGEYARKMIDDYKDALQFVEDYFQMGYQFFLAKYFKSRQKEISVNITPVKFRQIFGELSPSQLKIINDKDAKYIVVVAGPGSGKTRVLVHKLASLMMLEDIRHEQLLMLTFSRAAANEFRTRLYDLIGNAAAFVEIKTFHSYCFDLLGRVGNVEKSDDIVRKAVSKINAGEADVSRITKAVLVIDEAQDMDSDEFELVKTLMKNNEDMRVIAVGDDDQNIYEFRGSSSKYMKEILSMPGAVKYELIENYRSRPNLVEFSDLFAHFITSRMKDTSIVPKRDGKGELKIVRYSSRNLEIPLVHSIMSMKLTGTVAVLTTTNMEALTIVGLLQKNGLPSSLVQSNDGFSLSRLAEIDYFMYVAGFKNESHIIDDDDWIRAKRMMFDRYAGSDKLYLCDNLFRAFESANRKFKYKSDFEIFLEESGLEDFSIADTSAIHVSTIHKVKGKEFDNVFLLLDNFSPTSDASLRQLYVAITRAKENLYIHLNGTFLDTIIAEGIESVFDGTIYGRPGSVSLNASMKDVWLDDFVFRQNPVSNLRSGGELYIKDGKICDKNGKEVVKLSSAMSDKVSSLLAQGYIMSGAEVNFIVKWWMKSLKKDILVLLPILHFSLQDSKDPIL